MWNHITFYHAYIGILHVDEYNQFALCCKVDQICANKLLRFSNLSSEMGHGDSQHFFVALHRIAIHSKLLKIWPVFHNQDPSLEHPSNPPNTGWISICGVVAGGGSSMRKWQDALRGKCDFATYPAALSCTHFFLLANLSCLDIHHFHQRIPWPLWQVHNNWLLALMCC